MAGISGGLPAALRDLFVGKAIARCDRCGHPILELLHGHVVGGEFDSGVGFPEQDFLPWLEAERFSEFRRDDQPTLIVYFGAMDFIHTILIIVPEYDTTV